MSTSPSLAEIPQVKGDKGTMTRSNAHEAGDRCAGELEETCRLKVSHNPENSHTSSEWRLKLSAHGNNVETQTF